MKTSPRRGMEVFDFKDDDEPSESIAGKILGKFKNPNSDEPVIVKYDLLECVAQGSSMQTKDVSISSVGVDADDCDFTSGNAILDASVKEIEENTNPTTGCTDNAQQMKFTTLEECSKVQLDNHESRDIFSEAEKTFSDLKSSSTEKNELNSDHSNPPSSDELDDVTSDAEESMSRSSHSNPESEMAEDDVSLNSYALNHCSGDLEMDDMIMTVVLFPDYVIYRDSYCTGPQLTFSKSSIKISYSTTSKYQEDFDIEWDIDDLINIKCQWFQTTETVMIKLQLISRDTFQDDVAHGTSGVDELKIAVVERNWPQKQEEIASLNQKYLAVWDLDPRDWTSATGPSMLLSDMALGTDGDDSPEQMRYFPVFNESFEDVIYPKGDSDAVSISKRDVDLLQPDTFINDTIIDFYIQYLKSQIQHGERHRFHFFNSFFFRKLADLDKDPSSASDGKAAFQRVRKWTRRVQLFEKDFVFIPVNFSLHWSLIVICHPGEVPKSKDEDLDKSLKVPCILHMDSIKGNHAGLKSLMQSYLWEEWKERQRETSDEVSSRFHNLRFVSLELPQQENSFDCGLFLLHYLELFLTEVPVNFSPFKITKSSNFLNVNWFPPSEASLKRTLIQRLIFELLENRSRDVSSSTCSDEDQPSKFPEISENEGVEFISARCSPGLGRQENLTSSQAGQGIEITLLSASSMRNPECVNESSLVLRDLFDPGASTGSLLGHCQSFNEKSSIYHLNGTISPMEEDAETGEQFMFLHSGDAAGLDHMTGVAAQTCDVPYSSKDLGVENYDIGISLQAKCEEINSGNEPPVGASDDSSETCDVAERSSPKTEEENELKSLPVENLECTPEGLVSAPCELLAASATVEGSCCHDIMQSGNENGVPISSFPEYSGMPVSQDSSVATNGIGPCDNVQLIEDGMVIPDSPGEKPAKKQRLSPPTEGEGDIASLAEDSKL
ncbi:probable ubiquitin-like-specific protease 2B isoform X2 [Humulus lupulus]|uniref:probable ubiquitin-like-specific protease 2B isoform X2 n=1 Tax=Humulus lupulus TaxID=3486 RepID=UPI002B40CC8F|nr:probable ubiquitin-like-specific protease 2B isoform X2 [Humulus lupulus]